MAVATPNYLDRLGSIKSGGFSGQDKPPVSLGSPSDRGPKPAPGGKRTSMRVKRKPAMDSGSNYA